MAFSPSLVISANATKIRAGGWDTQLEVGSHYDVRKIWIIYTFLEFGEKKNLQETKWLWTFSKEAIIIFCLHVISKFQR
jgi:hypothetical protein